MKIIIKILLKILDKIILFIAACFILVSLVWYFFFIRPYSQIQGSKEFWDYIIWERKTINWTSYNICGGGKWCLLWEIKWLQQVWEDIYIYIKNNYYMVLSDTNVSYKMYVGEELRYLKSVDDLPKFWYLSWDKVEFYSENDMKNLPEEMQKIFREIEKHPTIIVDWEDYTKK